MSLSNTTENATLKAHLQGTDPSYRRERPALRKQ